MAWEILGIIFLVIIDGVAKSSDQAETLPVVLMACRVSLEKTRLLGLVSQHRGCCGVTFYSKDYRGFPTPLFLRRYQVLHRSDSPQQTLPHNPGKEASLFRLQN